MSPNPFRLYLFDFLTLTIFVCFPPTFVLVILFVAAGGSEILVDYCFRFPPMNIPIVPVHIVIAIAPAFGDPLPLHFPYCLNMVPPYHCLTANKYQYNYFSTKYLSSIGIHLYFLNKFTDIFQSLNQIHIV